MLKKITSTLCLFAFLFSQIPTTFAIQVSEDKLKNDAEISSLFFIENKGQVLNDKGKKENDIIFTSNPQLPIQFYFKKNGYSVVYPTSHEENPNSLCLYRTNIYFKNISRHVSLKGLGELDGNTNFYTASNYQGLIGLKNFKGLVYEGIYPGINLEIHLESVNHLIQKIISTKDTSPEILEKVIIGADSKKISATSNQVTNPHGYWIETIRLNDSQENEKKIVKPIPSMGPDLTTVPEVKYTTYYNGVGLNDPVWGSGKKCIPEMGDWFSTYLYGYTKNPNLPSQPDSCQPSLSGENDLFLSKFSTLGAHIFTTYFGGTENEYSSAIKNHPEAGVVVVGRTNSFDYPTTSDSFQPTKNPLNSNHLDGLVTRFDAQGKMIWSSYYGGSGYDLILGLDIDDMGNIYVSGTSDSTDLLLPSGIPISYSPVFEDAFVTKIASDGTSLLWGTAFGGSGDDSATSVSVSPNNVDVYACGGTFSPDLPMIGNPFQDQMAANGNPLDGFIIRLNQQAEVVASTYYGGSQLDALTSIGTDISGKVSVFGHTKSLDIPLQNPIQSILNQSGSTNEKDLLVASFNTNLSTLSWATYFGGSGDDGAYFIGSPNMVVDPASGNLFFTNTTHSLDYPTTLDALYPDYLGGNANSNIGDIALTIVSSNGALLYSTYFGGSHRDGIGGVSVDGEGNLAIGGITLSQDIETTEGAYQEESQFAPLFADGFLSRLTYDLGGEWTDVRVVKTAWLGEDQTDTAEIGDEVTYQIAIANAGPIDAHNVVVTDNFPFQLDLIGIVNEISIGDIDVGAIDINGNSALISLEYMEANSLYLIKFNSTVTNTAQVGSIITNTASLVSMQETDYKPYNDTSSVDVAII